MTHDVNSIESSSSLYMLDEGINNNDLLASESDPFLEIPDPLVPEVDIPEVPPPAKKCRVSTQDIQKMQLEVLTLEKKKIELDVENMQLLNQKLRLEIEELLAKSQPISLVVQSDN